MENVAVIGAGPYGLSIAAHLAAAGVDFRVFGSPMQTWAEHMPKGMHLKSEGFATSLYDAHDELRLSAYCAEQGIDYADIGKPVAVRDFVDYGHVFQRRLVPMLEQRNVVALSQAAGGFELVLDDGKIGRFSHVIVAVGITGYAHVPQSVAALPAALLSHSSARCDYGAFGGQRVVVIGGGASAVDCAVELAEVGAEVEMVARRPLRFHNPPRTRTLSDKLRTPFTEIGPGWRSVALTHGPLLFHAMPERFRHDVTRRYLGPSSCWFTRGRIEAGVHVHTGAEVVGVGERGGRAVVNIRRDNMRESLEADHVIAATGYRVDVARLPFLAPALGASIAQAAGTPVLSRDFETSVPGLYFVGASSANAFGPLMRFACGARFTARRLTKRLAGSPALRTAAPAAELRHAA